MGFLPSQIAHRNLIIVYIVLICFVVIYMFGIPPKRQLIGVIGWTDATEETSSIRTIPCSPRDNVVFLKMHKCASTSVQNILMRYAHQRNLTVVVPVLPKNHAFSLLLPFQAEVVHGAPWQNLGYNIICHHMVFNKAAIEKIMPKDSVYITILREPVSMFESLYEYGELEEFYQMDIEEYAKGIKNSTVVRKLRVRSNGIGRNQMLYSLGVQPSYFNNRLKVLKAIDNIDTYFDFVMIAKYFDESMILLRHLLCWEMDDVVSFTLNARMENYKKNLTVEAIKNLKEWNWGDQLLYDHFLQKFEKAVKEFGKEKMELEVQELRKRRNDWFDFCVQERVEAKNLTSYSIWSNKVSGYVLKSDVNNITCEDLVKPENYFTSEIRQHQLIQSIKKGAKMLTYGPLSFRHLVNLNVLKGQEQEFARNLLLNQYKYRRRNFSQMRSDKERNHQHRA
ncbi:galactose-3-O-sulfotransferase 4-like [Uloborus diversus]|uniref:galactose-3-O-sulfotransferase 4-like n=1 Tax=Uloborus diversus TaxID=327109 RepID=UPI0024098630|nr:galactose-3-O-sulfotransferase 4-like [Uloborus diversus]